MLAKYLKNKFDENDMHPALVARKLNTSRATVHNWVKGTSIPSFEYCCQIAGLLSEKGKEDISKILEEMAKAQTYGYQNATSLKLYKVERTDRAADDQFQWFIVATTSEEKARHTHPNDQISWYKEESELPAPMSPRYKWKGEGWYSFHSDSKMYPPALQTWVDDVESLVVSEIGSVQSHYFDGERVSYEYISSAHNLYEIFVTVSNPGQHTLIHGAFDNKETALESAQVDGFDVKVIKTQYEG